MSLFDEMMQEQSEYEKAIEELKEEVDKLREENKRLKAFEDFKLNNDFIPISVIQNNIDELEEEIEQLERRQNEIIGCDGDDTLTREEIWLVEDKIHLLKKLLEERE